MAAAVAGGVNKVKHGTFLPKSVSSSGYSEFDDDEDIRTSIRKQEKDHLDLLAAAKRAGVPKNEWGRLNGHKTGGVVVTVNGRKVPKIGFKNF